MKIKAPVWTLLLGVGFIFLYIANQNFIGLSLWNTNISPQDFYLKTSVFSAIALITTIILNRKVGHVSLFFSSGFLLGTLYFFVLYKFSPLSEQVDVIDVSSAKKIEVYQMENTYTYFLIQRDKYGPFSLNDCIFSYEAFKEDRDWEKIDDNTLMVDQEVVSMESHLFRDISCPE